MDRHTEGTRAIMKQHLANQTWREAEDKYYQRERNEDVKRGQRDNRAAARACRMAADASKSNWNSNVESNRGADSPRYENSDLQHLPHSQECSPPARAASVATQGQENRNLNSNLNSTLNFELDEESCVTPHKSSLTRSSSRSSQLSRSYSDATYSSGFSTPPSQMSTPSTDCPSKPRRRYSVVRREQVERLRNRFFSLSGEDDEYGRSDEETMTPSEKLRHDRKAILKPILRFFDSPWLAPRQSDLFMHMKKKTPNPDGSYSFRKNETLNLRLWQKLIRRALKEIMGPAYLTNHLLTTRYRIAARKIITKRRANHVQSWRIHNTHKRLIYDGDSQGSRSRKRRVSSKTKSNVPRVIKLEPPLGPVSKERKGSTTFDADQEHNPFYDEDFYDEGGRDVPCNDEDFHDEGGRDVPCKPPVSMEFHRTRCSDCCKQLECRSAFPQDYEDWGQSKSRSVRCASCWNKHVKEKLMPEMDECIQQKSLKKKRTNTSGPTNENRVNAAASPTVGQLILTVLSTNGILYPTPPPSPKLLHPPPSPKNARHPQSPKLLHPPPSLKFLLPPPSPKNASHPQSPKMSSVRKLVKMCSQPGNDNNFTWLK